MTALGNRLDVQGFGADLGLAPESCVQVFARGSGVLEVRLCRPTRRNAFDPVMIECLHRVFADVGQDRQLRAVVLSAEGSVFCAGADLGWMRAMAAYTWEENHADARRLAQMFATLDQCPVPLVGRVQGDALGGGVGLLAVCDVVLATPDAGFTLSEVKWGLLPATIAPYVVRAIGARAARRYFLTAERMAAAQALDMGLVHEVCAPDALDDAVNAVLAAIVANGPEAVRACKQLVRDVAEVPLDEQLREDTARRIAHIRSGAEAQEGLRAFIERRPPAWRVS
jgi:methylglutaconyl-CoA hydratase